MKRFIIIAVAIFTLGGCTSSDIYSGDVYTSGQAKQLQTVSYGTILSLRPVKIQTNDGQGTLGLLSGAVVGGLLGDTVGGGSGKRLATAAGAIAGGLAGSGIENKVAQTNALELEIRKDSGNSIVVVQKARQGEFKLGQRVRIVSSGSTQTVSPL